MLIKLNLNTWVITKPNTPITSRLFTTKNLHIIHGKPIIEKKSIFQAHLIYNGIRTREDALNAVRLISKSNDKRLSSATHHISAYRICKSHHTFSRIQDLDLSSSHTKPRRLKQRMEAQIPSGTFVLKRTRNSDDDCDITSGCDDDGESAAGQRLLHLLHQLHVHNAVVVVSRWYGGIKLGPDRFKLINNAARDLLVREGFVCDK